MRGCRGSFKGAFFLRRDGEGLGRSAVRGGVVVGH
jgi:hypothetical protein